jgi:hypothetical protein
MRPMRERKRIVWAALLTAGGILLSGCNDEKKPPLTPDGPEMTAPVGGDGGPEVPANSPTPAPTPAK